MCFDRCKGTGPQIRLQYLEMVICNQYAQEMKIVVIFK